MDKLSIRAYEGKLVGYAEEAKAYRICIPSLKKNNNFKRCRIF